MNKKLFCILIFCLCILVSCKKENRNFTIVDTNENGACAAALEEFYKDRSYVYSFPCIMSDYIVVKYDDGTEENIKDALKNKNVDITDLDKFDIKYYKDKK